MPTDEQATRLLQQSLGVDVYLQFLEEDDAKPWKQGQQVQV